MAALIGVVGLGVYWSYRKFEDLRAPRVVLDASEPTEVGLVSIRQLRRHRKRWIARVQRLEDILKVRHEITLGIPWDQAEAALVEAQDMVADLTAAIAAVEELHLRKAKFTNPKHAIVYSDAIPELENLPCPLVKPPTEPFDFRARRAIWPTARADGQQRVTMGKTVYYTAL